MGVHWVNADSGLMPVLGLGPGHKMLRAHGGSSFLAEACRPLKALLERLLRGPTRVAHRLLKQLLEVHEMGGAGSQGGISGIYQASENSDLALWGGLNTGKTVSAHQPHESRLPHTGTMAVSFVLKPHNCPSLYVSDTS